MPWHVRKAAYWSLLLGLLAGLLPSPTAQAQPQPDLSWEYRSLPISDLDFSDQGVDLMARLDRQGAVGWEATAVVGEQIVLRRPPDGGIAWEHQALDLSTSLLAGQPTGLSQQLNLLEAAGWEASLLVGPYLLLKRPAWGGGPWEHVTIDASSILQKSDPPTAAARLNALGAQGWELSLVIDKYLLFKRPARSTLRFEYLRDDSAASLGPGLSPSNSRLATLGAQGWELIGSSGPALLLRRDLRNSLAWEYQGLVSDDSSAAFADQFNRLGALGYVPALARESLLVLKRPGPALGLGTPAPTPSVTRTPAPTRTAQPTPSAARTPAPIRTSRATSTTTRTLTPTSASTGSPTLAATRTAQPTRTSTPTPSIPRTAQPPSPSAQAPSPPIVLVPGYLACSEAILGSRPRWELAESAAENAIARTALLPVVADQLGYGSLVRALLAAGMQLSRDLFIACPNWAESMPVAAERLAEMVRRAAASSKDDPPVTILTHGEGGLVARYYLQQGAAESHALVGDLLMLAPPNQGIVSTYYLWEGGDLSFEPVAARWLDRFALGARCRWADTAGAEQLSAKEVVRCVQTGSLQTAPALAAASDETLLHGWLIADSAFLDDGQRRRSYPSAPIRRLNEPAQIEALFSGLQGSVTIFAGAIERSTIASLPIQPRTIADPPLWRYGRPDPARAPEVASGDGWVLLESTRLPINTGQRYHHQVIWGVDHRGLLVDPQVYAQLGALLGLKLTLESPTAAPLASDRGLDLLLAAAGSPVDLLLSDQQGQAVGLDAAGMLRRDIPNAYYGVSVSPGGPQFVLVPQPAAGSYRLDVRGKGAGRYLLQLESGAREQPLLLASGEARLDESRTYLADYQPATRVQPFSYALALQIMAVIIVGLTILLLALTSRRPTK